MSTHLHLTIHKRCDDTVTVRFVDAEGKIDDSRTCEPGNYEESFAFTLDEGMHLQVFGGHCQPFTVTEDEDKLRKLAADLQYQLDDAAKRVAELESQLAAKSMPAAAAEDDPPSAVSNPPAAAAGATTKRKRGS